MRTTIGDKLKMVEAHILEGKSLSHVSEIYGGYDVSGIKYLVNLYNKHGKEIFINRERREYRRDTKLLAISRVKNGESIRSVALDLGIIEPTILGDWIKLYNKNGEEGIKTTYARRDYMTKDERAKHIVDQTLKEENERLRAEIEYLKKSSSLAQKLKGVTNKEKSLIVTELRREFKLEDLLEIAGLSSSTYYYNMEEKDKPDRYKALKDEIDHLYIKVHKKRIGYQKIYNELKKKGFTVGKNKVYEIMRDKGYLKVKRKKWRKYSSYAGDLGWVKPNHMNRDFTTTAPYQKGGTDITIFPLEDEIVYLSPVIDFHTREILSYSLGTNAKMNKIVKMLNDLRNNHVDKVLGMMIQSDQGIQYQNSRYSSTLKEFGIIQSMSRKGNCLDNSPTENFFGAIKRELWYGNEDKYKNASELMKDINEYINYYNNVRPLLKHKMSPYEYRQTSNKEL